MAGNTTAVDSLLNGRVAIVTGASRGIGRGVAIHLRSLGARIVINYTSNAALADALAVELNSNHPSPVAIAVRADVSNPDDVKSLFDQAETAYNTPAHILVHCAAISEPRRPALADTKVEEWDTTFSVNARGTFLTCREAANRLVRGGGGRIVTVSSAAVAASITRLAAYAASKAAVETMTRILAKELKGSGITANCVAPGAVETDMLKAAVDGSNGADDELMRMIADGCPLGRLGQPDDVARLVGFLASDGGEWVNGQVIGVNGGSTV